MNDVNDPRFPIGRFEYPSAVSPKEREAMLERIAAAPARLRAAVTGTEDEPTIKPYDEAA